MADHYTLVGSTDREIEGGTVLIGGVEREIESGLVLVGGVAREIEFGGEMAVITITGSGAVNKCYVGISGTQYTSAATVEVELGTEITVCADSSVGRGENTGVFLNGTKKTDGNVIYAVSRNVSINLKVQSVTEMMYISKAEITEE